MSKEIENILRKLYETIEKFYPEAVKIDYKKYLEKSGLINLLNNQEGSLTFLVDIKNLKVIYISENVLKCGNQEIEDDNLLPEFISFLAPEHLTFLSVFVIWSLNTLKIVPAQYKTKHHINVWGLKLLDKNHQKARWYMNIVPLEFNIEQNPTLVALSIQEITHLIKGDDYMIRASFGEKNEHVFVYHSNEEKTVEHDIISEREGEVLRYVSQGFDTKQISQLMNISPNTVDNHRRNMLARTGTRDTTALIQLCKMLGLHNFGL
ncbi:response regulator transcription factor [Emticicia sp. SJ17W-69]|uniref:response regulator transcription factor n=1 Tax=Emticicia sp. SJ17W-69 TaxID=3421657 RepID=UPI003EBE5148